VNVWVNGWWLSRAVAPDSLRVEIELPLIRSSTSQPVDIDEPIGSRTIRADVLSLAARCE
jgi:hypothetical protein